MNLLKSLVNTVDNVYFHFLLLIKDSYDYRTFLKKHILDMAVYFHIQRHIVLFFNFILLFDSHRKLDTVII